MINTNITVSNYCILFTQMLAAFVVNNRNGSNFIKKKKKSLGHIAGLDTGCCIQHCVADVAYPPHFQKWEKRVAANFKSVLTYDHSQAVTMQDQCVRWREDII